MHALNTQDSSAHVTMLPIRVLCRHQESWSR